MTHHDFFQAMIRDIQAVGGELEIAVVRDDGMDLVTNITEANTEAHLSAYSSIFMDYGNKLLQMPGQTHVLPVQLNLTVTAGYFILITRLDDQLSLVVRGKERERIAPLMKKCLDQAEQMKKLNDSGVSSGH